VRCDLILIVGIVVQGSCSVHCAGTNRAYSVSMGGIVVSSSSPCLLQSMVWLFDHGHSWPVRLGRRENVDGVTGSLERANGGAASDAGLGRVGNGQCRLWGLGEVVMLLAVGLCPRPLLSEASDEVGEMGWFAHMSCWRPSKEEFIPSLFC
jgi:hypothetical protein